MAQDIIQRGSSDSELASLNGYLIRLAEKHQLCREKFGKPGFKPLDVTEVWERVQSIPGR